MSAAIILCYVKTVPSDILLKVASYPYSIDYNPIRENNQLS